MLSAVWNSPRPGLQTRACLSQLGLHQHQQAASFLPQERHSLGEMPSVESWQRGLVLLSRVKDQPDHTAMGTHLPTPASCKLGQQRGLALSPQGAVASQAAAVALHPGCCNSRHSCVKSSSAIEMLRASTSARPHPQGGSNMLPAAWLPGPASPVAVSCAMVHSWQEQCMSRQALTYSSPSALP